LQSKAKTATEYIKALPSDRVEVISNARKEILKNLPKGFEETMQYGMITYVVPHKLYPAGYHVKPTDQLPLYHMAVYEGKLRDWFVDEWMKISDKKLDIGKACIRFKKVEDVPVKLIGKLASKMTPKQWIKIYEEKVLDSRKQK
jgi:hypothetical protein